MRKLKLLFYSLISALLLPFTTLTAFAQGGYDTGDNTVTGDTVMVFTNDKHGTIPTGILMKTWPVLLLIAVAVIGLLIWFFASRKKGGDAA